MSKTKRFRKFLNKDEGLASISYEICYDEGCGNLYISDCYKQISLDFHLDTYLTSYTSEKEKTRTINSLIKRRFLLEHKMEVLTYVITKFQEELEKKYNYILNKAEGVPVKPKKKESKK